MKIKILIIDDSSSCLELMTQFLRRYTDIDWDIETADSGFEGIEKAKANPPQVALVDMQLRNGTGYDVIAAFNNEPVLRNVLTIAITGHHQTMGNRLEALAAGFHDLIFKPLDAETFGASVSGHLCPS